MVAGERIDVGVGRVNIPGLHRLHDLLGLLADGFFNDLDEAAELDGTVIADIVDTVQRQICSLRLIERG